MTTQFIDRIAVETNGSGDDVLLIHGSGRHLQRLDAGDAGLDAPPHRAAGSSRLGPVGPHRGVPVDRPVRAGDAAGLRRSQHRTDACAWAIRWGPSWPSISRVVAPQLVRSLALFGPLLSPPDAARPGIKARAEKARGEGEAGMQVIADAIVEAATSADTRTRQPAAVAMVRESVMRQTPDGYARSCEALANAQPADPAVITCPTLMVTGDEDAIAPPQAVRQIGERLADARVEILPRCGHWTTA